MTPFIVVALLGLSVLVGCSPAPETSPGEATPAAEAHRAADAQGIEARGVEVREARVQLAGGTGAVYLEVENPGPEADRLLSIEAAEGSWAGVAELHETVDEDGVLRMVARPEGFEVPASGRLELVPGGKHAMILDPPPPEASSVRLTLRFESAGALELDAPVVSMGQDSMGHDGMDHDGMDHSGMDHSGMDHGEMEP